MKVLKKYWVLILVIVAALVIYYLLPRLATRLPYLASVSRPTVTANFYVATDGSDTWSGTLAAPNTQNSDGPFASVARAQLAVEKLLTSKPTAPITVMIEGGTYYLPLSPTNPGTLNFTSADSGSSTVPITWENYPGETPIISAGVAVGAGGLNLTWTSSSTNLWQVKLPTSTVPFETLYYNGARRLRSRLASADGVGYYMSGSQCISTQTGQVVNASQCDLGTFLRMAASVTPGTTGCPSVTVSGDGSKCLDRFVYNASDTAAVTNFTNLNATYSGNPAKPCTVISTSTYPAGDVEVTVFDAWTVDVMRVNCVDTKGHIVYLTGPTQSSTQDYIDFGPAFGHRYIIENTKNAFTAEQAAGQTGIWFLDRSASPWTLDYLANPGENPNTDTVIIPQLSPATSTGGSILAANGLNYVTFSGITFEDDNFTPPATGFNNDENGEGTLPEAIDCESCSNVTFNGITVRNTSASGILVASLSGHSGPVATNDTIENSAFYDIGATGIRIGHDPNGSDQYADVVQFSTVENNIVQGYSRIFADGEGIGEDNGHDITYTHNDIDDGYHAGISICWGSCPAAPNGVNATNIVSEYNHIWNVMQGITSDGGTLYYNTGGSNGAGTGDKILNNLLSDTTDAGVIDGQIAGLTGSGYGGHGIYLDNQTAGVDVENNVVYDISGSALEITAGPAAGQPANTFNNNILAYANRSMFDEQKPWPQGCLANPTTQANVTNNIFYFNNISTFNTNEGCAYSCGMNYNTFQNFQGNVYWQVGGGFATDTQAFHVLTKAPTTPSACVEPPSPPSSVWTYLTAKQWQGGKPPNGIPPAMNEDTQSTMTTMPAFGTSGLATDFLLTSNPISSFNYLLTNATINTAGRTAPVIMPPAVAETFPTYYNFPTGSYLPTENLSPITLNFGNQNIGATSSVQKFMLTNTGGATMELYSIGITGQFSEMSPCGPLILSGATCTISVFFHPLQGGPLSGTLTLTDNSSGTINNTQTFSVTGSGTSHVPPTVPANLKATAISSTQINLSWSSSTDQYGTVVGYYIYRGGVQIATTSNTTYSDVGLTPNTTYTYKVAAYDSFGNVSPKSAAANATTLKS